MVREVAMNLRRRGHNIGAILGGGAGATLGGAPGAAIGAAAGSTTEAGTSFFYRRALHSIATNPQLAERLVQGVQMGASPRVVGPLLAAMMLHVQDRDPQPVPEETPR